MLEWPWEIHVGVYMGCAHQKTVFKYTQWPRQTMLLKRRESFSENKTPEGAAHRQTMLCKIQL